MSWVGPKLTLLSNYTKTPLSRQKCLLREKGMLLLSEMRCPFSAAFSMRKAPHCMHNSAESLWWPFYWPLTKSTSTGAIVMDASICIQAIRGYLHFLSAAGPVGFWHATEGTGLCPPALQVQIGVERGAALLSTSVTDARGEAGVCEWLMCEGSRPLCVGSALLSLCFCMLEGVSTCWSQCMRWNELASRKSTRKAKHPTHNRHKCSQTDRWEKCVLTRDHMSLQFIQFLHMNIEYWWK